MLNNGKLPVELYKRTLKSGSVFFHNAFLHSDDLCVIFFNFGFLKSIQETKLLHS